MMNQFKGLLESRKFVWFTVLLFVFSAAWIALSTKFGIPPDEIHHFTAIKLYSERSLDPFLTDQSGYFVLGEALRTPSYLYHYLLSFPMRLMNIFGVSELAQITVLRFINIGISTGTLFAVFALGRKLKINNTAVNLSIFMLANTLMFVFLSASINYDNLVNLLAVTSFIYFAKLLSKFTPQNFFIYLSILMIGMLTKITFLPLALFEIAILTAVLTYRKLLSKNLRAVLSYVKSKKLDVKKVVFLGTLTLLLLLTIERYGLNLARYGKVTPKCTQIHEISDCKYNAVFRRGVSLRALEANVALSPIEFGVKWAHAMKSQAFALAGHKYVDAPRLVDAGTYLLIVAFLVGLVKSFELKLNTTNLLWVLAIAYMGLLLLVNYLTYSKTGQFGLALQSRYAFPVLPLMYILGSSHIFRWLKHISSQVGFALLVLVLFLYAALPVYLLHTDPGWHVDSMIGF